MNERRPGRMGFAFASFLLFLAHTPLLWIAEGEFTDGVLQAVYFKEPIYTIGTNTPPARYVPPLYPGMIEILSQAGMTPYTAGRLLSMTAYAFCAFVIGVTASGIGGVLRAGSSDPPEPDETGWIAWGFWAFSPMANRWSFHYMTDMMFCFLALVSFSLFLRFGREREGGGFRLWLAANGMGVLSLWTRFQGIVLAGVSLLALAVWRHRSSRTRTAATQTSFKKAAVAFLLSFLMWGGSLAALRWGGGVHGAQFAERSVYPWQVYVRFAAAAFRYLPYAVTPPLFLLFVWGTYRTWVCGGLCRFWVSIGLVGGVVGLVVHTFFLSFQFRYGLPLLPWVCILGALGVSWLPKRYRRPAAGLTGIWLVAMSATVLYCQHGTFRDIREITSKVRDHLSTGNRVWGFEEYNRKEDGMIRYGNIKFSVWSETPVQWLGEEELDEVREGDLILWSNVYPSLPPGRLDRLRKTWNLVVEAEATSETIPLFPGEILWVPFPTPSGIRMIRGTSDPGLMPFRFRKQYYSSVLYRVDGAVRNR